MATTTALAGVVFPPRDLNALLDLGRFLEQHTEPGLLLGPDCEQVPLPEEVYRVLVEVVEAMREGKVITLVPRCGCRKPMPPGDTHESRRQRGPVAEPGIGQDR
jgi:hypothetical protein